MTYPIAADLDGDGDLESIEGEGNLTRVIAAGVPIWEHRGPIDGWNRSDDDQFRAVADVDGDGTPEILVEDPNDGWTGLWKWQGGAFHAPWMAQTPIDGWIRHPSDVFYPADVHGDGRQELVIFNNADRWTGMFEWLNGALRISWKSPSPIDGFNRGPYDRVAITDIDEDGKQEVIIVASNDGWAGVFKWQNGGLHVFWASASPIGGPVGECDLRGTMTVEPKIAAGHKAIETTRLEGPTDEPWTERCVLTWNGAGLELIGKQILPLLG